MGGKYNFSASYGESIINWTLSCVQNTIITSSEYIAVGGSKYLRPVPAIRGKKYLGLAVDGYDWPPSGYNSSLKDIHWEP